MILESHEGIFIKDAKRHYRHDILYKKGKAPKGFPNKNTNRVFTEAQMREAESIPDTVDLTDGKGNRFEWLKLPADSRFVTHQGRHGFQFTILYEASEKWDRTKYREVELYGMG